MILGLLSIECRKSWGVRGVTGHWPGRYPWKLERKLKHKQRLS